MTDKMYKLSDEDREIIAFALTNLVQRMTAKIDILSHDNHLSFDECANAIAAARSLCDRARGALCSIDA